MDAPGGVVGVGGECHAAQVVGADGEMDAAAMERFAAAEGLRGRGLSYAVVSILGPQGSGTYVSRVILPSPAPPPASPSLPLCFWYMGAAAGSSLGFCAESA